MTKLDNHNYASLEVENGQRASQKLENGILFSHTAMNSSFGPEILILILKRHRSLAYKGHVIVLEWDISRIVGHEKEQDRPLQTANWLQGRRVRWEGASLRHPHMPPTPPPRRGTALAGDCAIAAAGYWRTRRRRLDAAT